MMLFSDRTLISTKKWPEISRINFFNGNNDAHKEEFMRENKNVVLAGIAKLYWTEVQKGLSDF